MTRKTFGVLICAVAIALGILAGWGTLALFADPGRGKMPALVIQATGMHLNEEERAELKVCMDTAKVMYVSQAVEKCLSRARYKN